MREVLGDLGFRSTKGGLGRRLGKARVCPTSARRGDLGGGNTWRWWRQGLGFRCRERGRPTPPYIGGERQFGLEGVLLQLLLMAGGWEGVGLPSQVGFLLSLHQANLRFDFFQIGV